MTNETQWVLVPREPTPEMIAAWPRFNRGAGHERAIYAAMLAASPSPPAGGGEPVASTEIRRAASALLNNLWVGVYKGSLTFEENWVAFDRQFPGVKWLHDALNAPDAAQQRIAALEEALEVSRHANDVFAAYGCPVCNGDCAAANPPVMGCPMALTQDAARRSKALGGGHE